MRAFMLIAFLVGVYALHVVHSGVVATTEAPIADVIKKNIDRLKTDCGPLGNFTYCPRNLECIQYSNGEWTIAKQPARVCDPNNEAHYGCACRYSIMTNGECTKVRCIQLMKEYYRMAPALGNDPYYE